MNHHLTEEELTILNPAREDVREGQGRARPGLRHRRNAQIDADCGRLENVRAVVGQAEKDGLLDNPEEE